MSETIKCNAEFMDAISNNYKSSSEKVQEAIYELNKAKTQFLNNYEGQGKDMAQDTFVKVSEHLEFLRSCLSQAEQYVTYTKETLQEQDEAMKFN